MDVDDTVERSYVQVVAVKERGWRRPGHGPSPCLFALALMVVCAGDFLCLFYGFGSVEALRVPVVCRSFIAHVRCVGVCAYPRPFPPISLRISPRVRVMVQFWRGVSHPGRTAGEKAKMQCAAARVFALRSSP